MRLEDLDPYPHGNRRGSSRLYSTCVSESGASRRVHLEYRLRPGERVLYSLLFGRQYRVLGPLGAVLLVLGILQVAPDWTSALLVPGVFLLFGFVWIPFNASLRSMPIAFDATPDGIDFDVGGMRAKVSWGAVRRTRRAGGAFVLEMQPAGTIAIPLRTFSAGELPILEDLAATARSPKAMPSAAVSTVADDLAFMRVRHEMRLRDAVLALWLRPIVLAPLIVGAVLLVGGVAEVGGPSDDPFVSAAWPLIGLGFVFLTLPVWGTAWRLYQGGGARAMTARYDIEIGAEGYRARLDNAESWTSWGSFQSVRRVGRLYVFRARGSHAEVVISARAFTLAQLDAFTDILRKRGLRGA